MKSNFSKLKNYLILNNQKLKAYGTFIFIITMAIPNTINRVMCDTLWDTSADEGIIDIVIAIIIKWWWPCAIVAALLWVFFLWRGDEKNAQRFKVATAAVIVAFIAAIGADVIKASIEAVANQFDGGGSGSSGT